MLMQITTVENAANIIGHKNSSTTQNYNRNKLTKAQSIKIIADVHPIQKQLEKGTAPKEKKLSVV